MPIPASPNLSSRTNFSQTERHGIILVTANPNSKHGPIHPEQIDT